MGNNQKKTTAQPDLNDQMQVRRDKMNHLREEGIAPFGHRFDRTDNAKSVNEKFDKYTKEELMEDKHFVTLAGRLTGKRGSGKAGFIDLLDRTGVIQGYARQDELGEESYDLFKSLDLGDFIGVKSYVIKTNTGALTLRITELTFLSKALRPLPDKWHGLTDKETIYRKRYLDLISNRDSFDRFIKVAAVKKAIREYLDNHGYLEVDTPVLQTAAGGAEARPFVTKSNAFDIPMYLRIATELYLKRLIVGGYEKVYELGKDFRNEGTDLQHNPEFNMVEVYTAYTDYTDVMDLIEDMIRFTANKVNGTGKLTYKKHDIDLDQPFKRLHMVDAVKEYTGIDFWQEMSVDEARKLADDNGIHYESYWKVGHIINAFFEEKVQGRLTDPTFIYGHPVEISPLAKKNAKDPRFTDRFELYIVGKEYGNAFTELNDPVDQRQRFEAQDAERSAGNEEAHGIDEDYLEAMEYGMPPTGGLGIGIDRLTMLLTGAVSIRDVMLFPTMRPLD
ncbi:lysine--tRNA ligase [Levilactobacillus spicheri]